MFVHLRRSVTIAVLLIAMTFAYALAGTGISQLLFNHQANGSLTAHGSTLIGQNWSNVECPGHPLGSCAFHGRPDATGPYSSSNLLINPVGHPGDDPLVANGVGGGSGATNLGPRSKLLKQNTEALVAYWHKLGVLDPTPDLVTTSGSGYDPDITPADAFVQVPMVSEATGIPQATLRSLIAKETNGAELGFLGSPYLVVLQLNEALAKLH